MFLPERRSVIVPDVYNKTKALTCRSLGDALIEENLEREERRLELAISELTMEEQWGMEG